VEEELKALENELNDAVNSPPPVTKKMLAFMLKSIWRRHQGGSGVLLNRHTQR